MNNNDVEIIHENETKENLQENKPNIQIENNPHSISTNYKNDIIENKSKNKNSIGKNVNNPKKSTSLKDEEVEINVYLFYIDSKMSLYIFQEVFT